MIDFRTDPSHYRHWRMDVSGQIATFTLDVDETGGLRPDYELKLNSYDLSVDIELNDAVQRLRFEHPEVRAVVIASGKERVFCAGANIRMLAGSSHPFKVNFCKFTNETRNAIEDASQFSSQVYLTAINGACAGGGYELALATDHIIMVDDGSTSVSLPEIPLLAVLPGTGGLTRLVDKRRVRRDRADFFCTTEEGVKGSRALEWGLIDQLVPKTRLMQATAEKAREIAARADPAMPARGISLTPLAREITDSRLSYSHLEVELDRNLGAAVFRLRGPEHSVSASTDEARAAGGEFWPLQIARELEDAILHLRFNEEQIGCWILRTEGDPSRIKSYDTTFSANQQDWFIREVTLYWKRVLKRLDLSSRSLFTLIEPGSCFHGLLFELALAADRSYMLQGLDKGDEERPATISLSALNFGPLPMSNGLTRLQSRFLGEAARVEELHRRIGDELRAEVAEQLGLVTFAPDSIDWEDEVRLAIAERAAFSPDALSGMEASLRFAGPETLESKIFARLSAWQNWVFQRPNATGEKGALKLYGSGRRPDFDRRRA
jgi:benzoyl-CoA-dihydrodiol lyase